MLTAITGLPGSGKSLFAVGRLLEGVKQDRPLYANIRGLAIPHEDISDWRRAGRGEQVFADLERFKEIENNALVVIDEAHEFFGAGMGKEMGTELRSWLAQHRHKGLDILVLFQDPGQMTNQLALLVADHYHCVRLSGFLGRFFSGSRITFYKGGVSKVKIWSRVVRDNKQHYAAYKTDVVGGKAESVGGAGARAILKPVAALLMAVMGLAFLFYRLSSGSYANLPPDDDRAGAAAPPGSVPAGAIPPGYSPAALPDDLPRWSVIKVCGQFDKYNCDKFVWERPPDGSAPVVE